MMMRYVALGAFALAAFAAPARAEDKPAKLSGFDAVVKPGETTKVRARLEKIGYLGVNPSVEGENLDFYEVVPTKDGEEAAAPKYITCARTDGSGFAEIDYSAKEPGVHELEVRIRKGAPYVAMPASITVLAPAPGSRVVVTDFEKTIADTSAMSFMTSKTKEVKDVEGAKDALDAVAKGHPVIYITGVEDNFILQAKDWLRMRGFPRGPVFAWDLKKNSLSGETFKTNLLQKLRGDAGGLALAIGGRAEDAVACAKLSITPFFVGKERDKDVPPEAIWAKAWSDVPELVAKQEAVEEKIKDLAGQDKAKKDAALAALVALDTNELGFVWRFARATDHSVAAAATLVIARVRAREAFSASLDTSSPNAALASLEAAWANGDRTTIAKLYKNGERGLAKSPPGLEAWRAIEIVTRGEPEPGKVVYRLRFLPAGDGAPVERDYALVRGDDGRWWADAAE